ncbi:MAG: YrdB family protein [Microbacterium sp.]
MSDTQEFRRITGVDVLRFLTEIAAFALLAVWGFIAWAFPWNVVVGIAAPAIAILLWALFVAPKAVFHVHPFVRMFVELVIFLSATIALWQLGFGITGIVFGVIAVATGAVVNARALR